MKMKRTGGLEDLEKVRNGFSRKMSRRNSVPLTPWI